MEEISQKEKNKKGTTEKCNVDFFKQDYGHNNPICDGTKCNVISECIMDLWKKNTPDLVVKEKRMKIIQGLAELSVRLNKEIAELFKEVNDGKLLPVEPPIFKLVLVHCESHKKVPIDFGD